jgi:hypothetical protein
VSYKLTISPKTAQCCSIDGRCGSDVVHCGTGCQIAFGACPAASAVEIGSTDIVVIVVSTVVIQPIPSEAAPAAEGVAVAPTTTSTTTTAVGELEATSAVEAGGWSSPVSSGSGPLETGKPGPGNGKPGSSGTVGVVSVFGAVGVGPVRSGSLAEEESSSSSETIDIASTTAVADAVPSDVSVDEKPSPVKEEPSSSSETVDIASSAATVEPVPSNIPVSESPAESPPPPPPSPPPLYEPPFSNSTSATPELVSSTEPPSLSSETPLPMAASVYAAAKESSVPNKGSSWSCVKSMIMASVANTTRAAWAVAPTSFKMVTSSW